MKAAILTIGDELTGGFTRDTNASWLAQELLKRGVAVTRITTVGDNHDAI
ncbi:MAG: competence/damage-inducible protein A, partial [Candidatus Marinimicrobia bacterium]|nr:competence/damage-inducible protein A [Candidatus Neomarinimicrobiota bacterium]